MERRQLWELIREAWLKLETRYEPAINDFVSKSTLGMREWMIMLAVLTFEPDDTTPSHLMVRGPYTSSDRYLSFLENAADQGYLSPTSPGRFRFSPKGRKAVLELIRVAREAMTAADPLTPQESERMVELFERLVTNCLKTPSPPNIWSISLSNKLMPTKEPAMPYIEQAVSCLSAYRDDAHLAAWQNSSLSASALESLTLIWREKVKTLDELTDRLYFRGHSQRVYIDALNELRERKYISGTRNALLITDLGYKFREEVEEKTEEFFFTPWDCLSDTDMANFSDLMIQMRDGLESS
jgi:hypothetical protein